MAKVYRDLEDELEEPLEVDAGLQACLATSEAGREHLPAAPRSVKKMTVDAYGMLLHAAVCIRGDDRAALERICRYLLRPPFAQQVIEALPDGRVRVHFKAPMRNGRSFCEMSRDAFLAKLAALVPPPRFNLVRYYGVLANQHRLREAVRPKRVEGERQLKLFGVRPFVSAEGVEDFRFVRDSGRKQSERAPSRVRWADLLARVFEIDVRRCGACGGRLRVVEVVGLERSAADGPARGPPEEASGQLELFGPTG